MEEASLVISIFSAIFVIIAIFISFYLQQKRKRKDFFYKKTYEFREYVMSTVENIQNSGMPYLFPASFFEKINGKFMATIAQCEILRIKQGSGHNYEFVEIKYYKNNFILETLNKIDLLIAENCLKNGTVPTGDLLGEVIKLSNYVDNIFHSLKGINRKDLT